MHIPVNAPILPVHVHIDRRIDHGMVERCVEHCFLIVTSLTVNYRKFAFPSIICQTLNGFKILSLCFDRQILLCTFCRYSRKGHFYFQLLFTLVKFEIGYHISSSNVGKILIAVKFSPESIISLFLTVTIAIIAYGLTERNCEIGIVRACPSIRDSIAGQECIVFYSKC